jgi:hypothetical protein
MKRLTLILLSMLLMAGFTARAQKKATINFTIKEFDFGKIKEEGGVKVCKFDFSNTGNDSLKILSVNPGMSGANCDWAKKAIPPKGKGFIQASWDPKSRPGPFQKTIEVTTNDLDQPRISLMFKGMVEPRPKTPADEYPTPVGHLRFKVPQVAFNNINNTDTKTDTVKMYNEWNQVMTISISKLPDYITCQLIPDQQLKPKQKGIVLVTYNAAKRNDFGYVNDRFSITTNDSVQPEKPISISANIVEDFSKMTPEQLQNAAKINFENTTYDFGTIKEGEKIEHDFKFTNSGNNDLFIRKVKGS